MKRLYGRTTQLERLNAGYRAGSQMWVVYGRRRVGKTEMIRRFCEGKPTFFFTGGRESMQQQIGRFLRQMADAFDQSDLC